MTMRAILAVLVLVACASRSAAHLVPIDPSTCALDLALASPAGGTAAVVDPPGTGDLVRTTYEADSSIARSRMQVCPADAGDPGRCGPVVARGFTVGATAGSIAIPSAFALRLFASGDLFADAVPITLTLDGEAHVVPFHLSTGYLPVGTPRFGGPLDASGAFALAGVGTLAAAAPLFGDATLRLDLACTLDPPPDLDQFALGPRLRKVRGTLTAAQAKLTMILETEVPLPGDFAAEPTAVQLGPAATPLVDLALATSAAAKGRFASAGGELTIAPLRRRVGLAYKLVLRTAAMPATPFASGESSIAVSAGGLVARRGVALRAKRRGSRLAVRER